jgi:hypothetical protein
VRSPFTTSIADSSGSVQGVTRSRYWEDSTVPSYFVVNTTGTRGSTSKVCLPISPIFG